MNNFHNSGAYASFFYANFHHKLPPGRIPTGRRFHLVLIGFTQPLDKLEFGGESPLTMRYELGLSHYILWAPRP